MAQRAELVRKLRACELDLIYMKNSLLLGDLAPDFVAARAAELGNAARSLLRSIVLITLENDLEDINYGHLPELFAFFGISDRIKL